MSGAIATEEEIDAWVASSASDDDADAGCAPSGRRRQKRAAATTDRLSERRIRVVAEARLGARRNTLAMLDRIARNAGRARRRLVDGLPASPQLADLENAAAALDSWFKAAGPLFERTSEVESELRTLIGSESPSESAIDDALRDLEGAATRIDTWLDEAGPLRAHFRVAVSALRDVVAATDGPQAAKPVETVGRYYDPTGIIACLREVNRRVRGTRQ